MLLEPSSLRDLPRRSARALLQLPRYVQVRQERLLPRSQYDLDPRSDDVEALSNRSRQGLRGRLRFPGALPESSTCGIGCGRFRLRKSWEPRTSLHGRGASRGVVESNEELCPWSEERNRASSTRDDRIAVHPDPTLPCSLTSPNNRRRIAAGARYVAELVRPHPGGKLSRA